MMKKKIFFPKRRPKNRHLIWVEKITNIGEIKLKLGEDGDTGSHYSCNKIYVGQQGGEFVVLFPPLICFQNISFIQALTYRKFCKALWVDFGYIHCLLDVTLDYHRCGHVFQAAHVSLGDRCHVTHCHASLK